MASHPSLFSRLERPWLLSSLGYLLNLPRYLYQEIYTHFWRQGRGDDTIGYGVVCNFPTMYVQKRFLVDGGPVFGIDLSAAMGYPYNLFAPPLRTLVLLRWSYPAVVLVNLALFVAALSVLGAVLGHPGWALAAGLIYALSAYNVWYNVAQHMVFLLGIVPMLLCLAAVVCFGSAVWAAPAYVLLYYTWPSLAVTLAGPLGVLLLVHTSLGSTALFVAIAALAILPYHLLQQRFLQKSRYRKIQNRLKRHAHRSRKVKNLYYLLLALAATGAYGINTVTLILLALVAVMCIDATVFSLVNTDYWRLVFDLLLIVTFIGQPHPWLVLGFLLVFNNSDFINADEAPKALGGPSLRPVKVDGAACRAYASLFAAIPAHSRIGLEVLDRDPYRMQIDAPKTFYLGLILHAVHRLAEATPVEYIYGVGCWEQEDAIFQRIARHFHPQKPPRGRCRGRRHRRGGLCAGCHRPLARRPRTLRLRSGRPRAPGSSPAVRPPDPLLAPGPGAGGAGLAIAGRPGHWPRRDSLSGRSRSVVSGALCLFPRLAGVSRRARDSRGRPMPRDASRLPPSRRDPPGAPSAPLLRHAAKTSPRNKRSQTLPMKTQTVVIGQLGLGYWGPNLLRNFTATDGCRVKWVADPDPARQAYARRMFPATAPVAEWQTVVDDPEVNAVVVVTPAATHFELARAALAAGKHVMVEKPLAMRRIEAQALCDLAARQTRVLMVGHTFLYNAAVRRARQYIGDGELGDIYYILSERLNLGRVRQDVNVMWNLAPHDIAIILYWLGEQPSAVNARGLTFIQENIPDVVFMDLDFPSGRAAHIHVSWLDPHKTRRMTVVGSKKMLVYDDVSAEAKITLYDRGIDKHNILRDLPEIESFGQFQLMRRSGDVFIPKIDFEEPLRVECRHFIDCIRQGSRPVSDGANGLAVTAVLEAAQEALSRRGGACA